MPDSALWRTLRHEAIRNTTKVSAESVTSAHTHTRTRTHTHAHARTRTHAHTSRAEEVLHEGGVVEQALPNGRVRRHRRQRIRSTGRGACAMCASTTRMYACCGLVTGRACVLAMLPTLSDRISSHHACICRLAASPANVHGRVQAPVPLRTENPARPKPCFTSQTPRQQERRPVHRTSKGCRCAAAEGRSARAAKEATAEPATPDSRQTAKGSTA